MDFPEMKDKVKGFYVIMFYALTVTLHMIFIALGKKRLITLA